MKNLNFFLQLFVVNAIKLKDVVKTHTKSV